MDSESESEEEEDDCYINDHGEDDEDDAHGEEDEEVVDLDEDEQTLAEEMHCRRRAAEAKEAEDHESEDGA